jgi:hypothetical protein
MKEIKSVRVRPKFSSGDDNRGLGDYKVILFDNGRRKFKVSAGQIGRVFTSAEYKREGKFENYTDDDFIKDGISILISKQNNNKEFEIIQDPWLDNPPKWRSYGFDPYYLNNGSHFYIEWFEGSLTAGGKKWSDDNGKELKISKNGDDTKGFITKIVNIWAPDSYKGENKRLKVTRLGIKSVSSEEDEIKYSGNMLDIDIIQGLLSRWNSQVPNYNVSLCEPEFRRCELIDFIHPDEDEEIIKFEDQLVNSKESTIEKEKLNILIPKDLKLKVKEDISFKIFLGDPPKSELPTVEGFDFGDEDDLSDLLLDDEFRESEFDGLSEAEVLLQEEVSSNQESFDKGTSTTLPDTIDISISSNLDDLLKDAGKAARVLGKNSRVNYQNLRIGYKKGIHGLCPQGTQAVLVAMTGIKELGLIKGNADWFSFKNPATGGKPWSNGEGLDKLIGGKSYYNSKVKINQINGSWKGTYLQNSNMWQVGDIIAMGYTGGKLYGHIQIWTGYSWMSDFKQNAIQQRNIDANTVALWRLNQNGIELLRNKRNIT